MADKVRKELLGCISFVPSYVKPRSLRKQNALKFSGSISPIKSNKCCKDTSSDISSPSKYLKLHSLLSQIEENCENDEKNELYSDASEEDR